MGNNYKRPDSGVEHPTEVAFPRRRLGRVEHDHLGNARMEWALLPDSQANGRQVLEIVDDAPAGKTRAAGKAELGLQHDSDRSFEPYGSGRASVFEPPREAPRKPKDLRKLGEWLKLTRELEERRKRGED